MDLKAAQVKKIFKEHGLSPKKWMGQNLLVDEYYLGKIVRAARLQAGESVVEVGAGLGVLTDALAAEGVKVCAIEVDSGFFNVLEERFRGSPQVEVIHADAMKYDFRALAARLGKLRVVANLPYSISSRLIFRFYEDREVFSSVSVLLQREVAMRLTAEAGTKDYGVLTVLLGISAEVETLFDIPGKAFYPVPEVTSTLVRISFTDRPRVCISDDRALKRIVKAAFASRRKTLRNNFRKTGIPGISWEILAEAADEVGIDLDRRGETLSPEEFGGLANAAAKRLN